MRDVVDRLVAAFRGRAAASFGLPDGESIRIRFVRGRSWSGYNWYEGGLRSRFDLSLDLPITAPRVVQLVAHEAYPGHHLEHAWKESELVERDARLEASVLLLNAPECVISEGLADLGQRFVAPPTQEVDLLVEILGRAGVERAGVRSAGVPAPRDPVRARELATLAAAVRPARDRLAAIATNAMLLRHADGRSHDEVLAYLVEVGRMAPDRAAKRLEFIEHPVTRGYVFVYSAGEALLRAWVDLVPEAERARRFGRLLREQLTPSAIAAEVQAARGWGRAPEIQAVSEPSTTPRASRS